MPSERFNPAKANYRIGEIIRGKIIDIPFKEIAVVQLPGGTCTAYLQGNVNKGDNLLFKVIATNPSLVLKVQQPLSSSDEFTVVC